MSVDSAHETRPTRSRDDLRIWALLAALAAAWGAIFAVNEVLWPWLLGDIFRADLDSTVGGAVEFFLYDTIKISLLLMGLLFLVGLVNTQISPEKVRAVLAGKGLFVGILLAVVLGAVTPFCSCSSIPIFIGLVAAGVPLAVTLAFLVSSPLISETGIILMGGTFGWDIAAGWAVLALWSRSQSDSCFLGSSSTSGSSLSSSPAAPPNWPKQMNDHPCANG